MSVTQGIFDWKDWTQDTPVFLPMEHLVRYLPEFTVRFGEKPVDEGIVITAHLIVPVSIDRDRQQAMFVGALHSCLREIERKVRELYTEGQEIHFWTPDEFSWYSERQFVEPPVRMFLENEGHRTFYVNMATVGSRPSLSRYEVVERVGQ